ncbi:MAG: ribose 5-phosphate isomerase B [Planctomycetota bacterium]
MKISIASDHRGHEAVLHLIERLAGEGHEVKHVGETTGERSDYPDGARAVGESVSHGDTELGILICGTGIGMSIAANKVKGVRAAVVGDELSAGLARGHNDANVLCLSADLLGIRKIDLIVDKFLGAPFEGGRHERRVSKINEIEAGEIGAAD